jgi:hypothetical protein
LKKGLQRVIQIRQLLEELAGLDLQTRTAELRHLERRAEEHRRLAAEARKEVAARLLDETAGDSWLEMADAEIFAWKKKTLDAAAQKLSEEVAVFRERRMIRRTERQQAEFLVSEAAKAEEQERRRLEQQHLDDWYQNLPGSR